MSSENILKRKLLTTTGNADSAETAKNKIESACQDGGLKTVASTATTNSNEATHAQTEYTDHVFPKYDTGNIIKKPKMNENTLYNVSTENKYQLLENENENENELMETDGESNEEEEEVAYKPKRNTANVKTGNKTNEKTIKPPPLVVRGKYNNHENIIKCLKEEAKHGFSFQFSQYYTHIYINDIHEWKAVRQILETNNTEYHTYTPKSEKTHAFVLKGLEIPVTAEEIASEIKEKHNINITNVYKMKNTKRPLYLVVTDSKVTHKHIEATVKVVCYTKIKWERHINNKIIIQCHRCQEWGHATTNCRANPACLKCAGDHWTRDCTKEIHETPKCYNCKGEHPANSTKCPDYIKKIMLLDKTKERRKQNNPRNTRSYEERIRAKTKIAPAPKYNAWEQRNKQRVMEQQQQQQQYTYKQQEYPHLPSDDQQHRETTQQQQQRPQNYNSYNNRGSYNNNGNNYSYSNNNINNNNNNNNKGNVQQNAFKELTSEFDKLKNLINIEAMLRAVRDLNDKLTQCADQMEKFKVFFDFTNELEHYGL